MRSEGYGSQFVCLPVCVCVCLSVCLSVTALTATNFVCKAKVRYHRVLHDVLQICKLVDFAKNASFKSYGVICLPPLPSTLPEELSMDRRNNSEFFLRRRVCTLSDSFCRTTDSSLFSVNELLSFLASPVHHVLASLAHVVTLRIAQLHVYSVLLWLLQFNSP